MNIIEFIESRINRGTPLTETEIKRILASIYFAYRSTKELSAHNYKMLVHEVWTHTNVSIDDFLKIVHNVQSMKNAYSMCYMITLGFGESVAVNMDKDTQKYEDILYTINYNTYGRLFFETYDDAERFKRKLTSDDFSEDNLNINDLYVFPYYFNYTRPNLVELYFQQGKAFVLG